MTDPLETLKSKNPIENMLEKNVPGRNIIVTSAIDLICRESWLVANAISTFVSPWALDRLAKPGMENRISYPLGGHDHSFNT
jgi:hypothetical protein